MTYDPHEDRRTDADEIIRDLENATDTTQPARKPYIRDYMSMTDDDLLQSLEEGAMASHYGARLMVARDGPTWRVGLAVAVADADGLIGWSSSGWLADGAAPRQHTLDHAVEVALSKRATAMATPALQDWPDRIAVVVDEPTAPPIERQNTLPTGGSIFATGQPGVYRYGLWSDETDRLLETMRASHSRQLAAIHRLRIAVASAEDVRNVSAIMRRTGNNSGADSLLGLLIERTQTACFILPTSGS